jgi:NADPH-dependent ferric siderophore reductase
MADTGSSLAHRLLDQFFVTGTVERVEPIARRMRRIAIAAPALRSSAYVPGQQVRVCVAGTTSRLGPLGVTLRTYSVWEHSGDGLELCVLDHGDGPGSAWARTLVVGDPVRFSAPKGGFTLRPAKRHVFVGEETASVAFGAMLRALPPDAGIQGVVEADGPEDDLPLPRAERLLRLHRNGAAAYSSQPLADAVAALDLNADQAVAYVAGEARTCQDVHRRLVETHGFDRRSVVVKPFWTPGKRGME